MLCKLTRLVLKPIVKKFPVTILQTDNKKELGNIL